MANRRTKIVFPVFSGYEIRIILANDMVRTGNRLHADLSTASGAFIEQRSELRGWIVLAPKPEAATIAHEASHAIRSMFNAVGVRADNENFAYHIGFLVDRIHKFLKRK